VLAYVELHIEQGPVLEGWGLPVGCVTSISGATRYEVTIGGRPVMPAPCRWRRASDALAAAAECVLAIEARCGRAGLVGTVGRIEAGPGAINVIPGRARFTIDVRAPEDAQRARAADDLIQTLPPSPQARRHIGTRKIYDMAAAPCAPWLMEQVDSAIAAEGIKPFRLPSGAGHDGMAMIRLPISA
jgi:allantoate deiminase